eukprot:CAMPEP_0117774878 /NCGR_PEP_ID=MMETSP0947-20121206/26789_1 /TAXON_ID=44440 /ORGANISM="Chattonella subsalsa, Strain CCMP2191" /LENGTH=146 /DNA_ID=CAMNT_0005601447 /DNA_START=403 /DNA_END=843 /DNA_ORIENTATION=+
MRFVLHNEGGLDDLVSMVLPSNQMENSNSVSLTYKEDNKEQEINFSNGQNALIVIRQGGATFTQQPSKVYLISNTMNPLSDKPIISPPDGRNNLVMGPLDDGGSGERKAEDMRDLRLESMSDMNLLNRGSSSDNCQGQVVVKKKGW